MDTPDAPLDVAALLSPLTEAVPLALRPRFLAALERWAAERYRGWAAAAGDSAVASRLLACAAREEEIATRSERLFAGAGGAAEVDAAVARVVEAAGPLYSQRPLREVLAIQAAAERLGARTWRALARGHADAAVRDGLEQCARLEEENAAALEAVLASGGAG